MDIETILQSFKKRNPQMMGTENANKFAVFVPLVKKNNETHVLFEVRSLKLRRQPGDVCFPGGRVDDEDTNVEHTAIRETSEELGLDPKHIDDVIPLDYIASERRIIYPFIGSINNVENMNINRDEVEEVFTVPITYFLETEPKTYELTFNIEPEQNFPFELIHNGKNYNWQPRKKLEHFYIYNNYVIWGLTARIIEHVKAVLKQLHVETRE